MSKLKNKIIILTKNDLKRAEKFAQARMNHNISQYKKRGAFKPIDLISGALGEMAVYKLLKQSYKMTKPDLELHEVCNKSFNADLQSDI